MKIFLQKKCKIFERWGLRPQTPVPPAAGGGAPRPPNSPPIANFWLRACEELIELSANKAAEKLKTKMKSMFDCDGSHLT